MKRSSLRVDLLLLPDVRSLSRRKSAAVIDVVVAADPLPASVGFIEKDHDILSRYIRYV